jgi:hypothetical protein
MIFPAASSLLLGNRKTVKVDLAADRIVGAQIPKFFQVPFQIIEHGTVRIYNAARPVKDQQEVRKRVRQFLQILGIHSDTLFRHVRPPFALLTSRKLSDRRSPDMDSNTYLWIDLEDISINRVRSEILEKTGQARPPLIGRLTSKVGGDSILIKSSLLVLR